MSICKHCVHFKRVLIENYPYGSYREFRCFGRYKSGLLQSELFHVRLTGRCEYFNKRVIFDKDGRPKATEKLRADDFVLPNIKDIGL